VPPEQVETLLKTQEPSAATNPDAAKGISIGGPNRNEKAAAKANFNVTDPSIGIASSRDMDRWHFSGDSPPQPGSIDEFNFNGNLGMNMNNVGSNFTWEIINLGLEEPLPPQETIDELYGITPPRAGPGPALEAVTLLLTSVRIPRHQIYFERIHPSVPMIHKFRYLAAMNL